MNKLFQYRKVKNGVEITKYIGTDTDVVIPSEIDGFTVTKIGRNAFRNCRLTDVVIPPSVKEIGDEAFANNKLTSVYIPDSVIEIEPFAFAWNRELRAVEIPKNCQLNIGSFALTHLSSAEVKRRRILITK